MKRHRSDDNTFLIKDHLDNIPGISYKFVSQVDGFVDMVVGWRGINYLWELKSDKGKLSKSQKDFHLQWSGTISVIRTIEDADKALGIKIK